MRKTSLLCFGLVAALSAAFVTGCSDDAETGSSTSATSSSDASTTGATTGSGGAGGDATSSTTTGGGGDGGGVVAPNCDDYCTAVMASCTGDVTQYGSMASCLGACAGFDVGTADDKTGNTVGCRTYHAGAATADPATHCVHAGPGGGDFCGSNCEGFCAIALSACTGANSQYADAAACATDCALFADTEPYDTSDVASNTLACRLYHLTVAATDAASATTHCPHITSASPVCTM